MRSTSDINQQSPIAVSVSLQKVSASKAFQLDAGDCPEYRAVAGGALHSLSARKLTRTEHAWTWQREEEVDSAVAL